MLKIPVTEIFILRPATLAVLGGIVVRSVRYVQQMGKHHLGHALCAVGRYIGDNDTSLLSGLDIHHIVARSQHTDVFQTRQLCYHLSVDDDLVGQHDFSVFSPCYRLFRTGAVIDRQRAKILQLLP